MTVLTRISIIILNISKWLVVTLWFLLTAVVIYTFYERLSHPNVKSISNYDLKLYAIISITVLLLYYGFGKLADKIKVTAKKNDSN